MKTSDKNRLKRFYSQVLADLRTMRDDRKDKLYSMPTLLTQKQRWDNEGGRVSEMSPNCTDASQTTKEDTR